MAYLVGSVRDPRLETFFLIGYPPIIRRRAKTLLAPLADNDRLRGKGPKRQQSG
jgi:hypothetical protein